MPASTTSSITLAPPAPLNPITPLQSTRYGPVEAHPRPRQKLFPAGPLLKNLDQYMHDLGGLPCDWEQFIHPDGKPYFRHIGWKVVTEAYIRDGAVRTSIENLYHRVEATQQSHKPELNISDNRELYLTLDPEAYYFVDHGTQSVFWLDDVPLEDLGLGVEVPQMSFELFIQRNYYRHLEHFPIHNSLPRDAEAFLRSALTHACTEHMTSRDSSTGPWNATDCKTYLDLLGGLDGDTSSDVNRDDNSSTKPIALPGYKTWFVSRLLCNILHSRWVHLYGMNEARTDRLASIHSKPRVQPRFNTFGTFLSGVFFFCAPFTYVDRLEKLWADKIVSLDGWQKLLSSLLVEWSDSNLLATVTLSANMALLALTDLSATSRAASVASAFLAIGSIVIGLHHVWRHRVKVDSNAHQAAIYLQNATRVIPSLKLLALVLSLPLVLLSWSLMTFAFAIALYTFKSRPWWTYASVGVVLFSVVFAIAFTILFFWDIFTYRQGSHCVQAAWKRFFYPAPPGRRRTLD